MDNIYGGYVNEFLLPTSAVQDPATAVTMGLIAVKLDSEGLSGTQNQKTNKSSIDKVVLPHVRLVSIRDLRPYRKKD